MLGFTLQNDSQGDDSLKTVQLRSSLNEKRNFKGARCPDKDDIRTRFQTA